MHPEWRDIRLLTRWHTLNRQKLWQYESGIQTEHGGYLCLWVLGVHLGTQRLDFEGSLTYQRCLSADTLAREVWWSCCCCCCSVAQSYLTLCSPMDCSTPGFSVPQYLLECAQMQVHGAGDAISWLYVLDILTTWRLVSRESVRRGRETLENVCF